MSEFTHLSLHSEYSLQDSVVFLKRIAPAIKEREMSSVALTDCNLFAILQFQQHCHSHGIKPIFGCDLTIYDDELVGSRLIALAMNDTGYRNLLKLVTRSYGSAESRVGLVKDQLKTYSDGIILLSGGVRGEVGQFVLQGDLQGAKSVLDWYSEVFPDRFYLEISRTGRKGENEYIHGIAQLADEKGLPLVATNDVVMTDESESLLHDARLSMQRGESMDDDHSWKGEYTEQQFMRTPKQMAELFHDLPDAIENAVEIAKRCNVEIPTGVLYQRPFPTSNKEENERILSEKTHAALEEELSNGLADEYDPLLTADAYRDRLKTELDVIVSMGYAGYFLIVQDMVKWAKDHDIPVGQGRGSGAASLVSMLLDITTIDPLRHKLIFERLLNPERRSMPDLDIDFCGEERDRVAHYLVEKYGNDVVGRIVSHGTKGARGAIQAMGRSMGVPYSDVSRITGLVPKRPLKITIQEALEQEPRIQSTANNLGCATLIDDARKLEGIVSTLSYHPAGIVIAPGPLDDYVACHHEEDHLITQLDKDDVESAGLVKFDLLSLKNLTAIRKCVHSINAKVTNGDPIFDIDEIDLDDRATFDLLSTGETQGVFQLGGREIQNLLRNIAPNEFKDIVAVIALYRPGPLNAGFHKDYYQRKHGIEDVLYDHPKLESILEENYGVMIYQEDVMNVARELAGFTLGDADIMREAMGKKRVETLKQVKDQFLKGCEDNDIGRRIAEKIYRDVEGFAEYAFPRAHATAYAMLSYQTGYLKANYPLEFMAANLSVFSEDRDQADALLRDVMRMNIPVLPPNVNAPNVDCLVVEESIQLGFPCLKGIGRKDVQSINQAHNGKDFTSLFDFCYRIAGSELTVAKVGYLIDAGVLDRFESGVEATGAKRANLHEKLKFMADLLRGDAASSDALFGGPDEAMVLAEYQDPDPFNAAFVEEKEREVLGQSITNQDTLSYFHEFASLATHTVADLKRERDAKVVLVGTIEDSYINQTQKGEEFANLTLQDHTGEIRAVLWPEEYRKFSQLVLAGNFVIVSGQLSANKTNGRPQVTVKNLLDPTTARQKWGANFALQFFTESNLAKLTIESLGALKHAITSQESRSGRPVKILLRTDEEELSVDLGRGTQRVEVNDETKSKLRSLFGPDVVHVQFRK